MESLSFMTRKQARENAFMIVFEKNFNEETVTEIIENAVSIRAFELDKDGYILKVTSKVFDNIEEVDKTISNNLSSGWRLERISKVSLSVLRLAVSEMLYLEDIPVGVSINEAVELTKKYSDEKDAAFVNGVLSSVNKASEN